MQYKQKLIDLIVENPTWRILDVGGGEQPCIHATDVIDVYNWDPAERQGEIGDTMRAPLGQLNYIEHDINVTPWPNQDHTSIIPDKHYDLVICSNVLEDIRDPIAVCKEMSRVGKRGVIEIPTVLTEMNRNSDDALTGYDEYPGFYHHRWFARWGDNRLEFLAKNMGALRHIAQQENSSFQVWWQGSIPAVEMIALSRKDYDETLYSFISKEEKRLAEQLHRPINTSPAP